jgi:hypothetical protein
MEERSTGRPRFDERAALEELERLREQIALRRSERRETGEEFERFVRSFRKPRFVGPLTPRTTPPLPAAPSAAPTEAEPAPADAPAAGLTHAVPPSSDIEPEVAAIPNPEAVSAAEPAIGAGAEREAAAGGAEPAAVVAPRAGNRARMLGAGALILLVASGFAAWTLRQEPAADPPASTAAIAAPAVPAAETPAASPVRESEILTTRRVWMRVIVDGERVAEREVPAGTRLPLAARKTILIRTGDAGAVRVTVAGVDQGVLGGAGQVVTRTFTVPDAVR